MKAYTMTATDLTINANLCKEAFLEKILQEKLITEEQRDKLNDYCITVVEKSYFGNIFDKVFNLDNKDMRIVVVKVIR